MVIGTQMSGSQKITPIYPVEGIMKSTNKIFPNNSMKLEINGVIFCPNPCKLFRRTSKTANTG